MKNVLALLILLLPLSAYAIVCDHSNPHPSSNNCMRGGCDPGDQLCEQCCDEICTKCHTPVSEETNFSDPTRWNQLAAQMAETFPEATEETTVTLADVCANCHSGNPEEDRFSEDHNHPVDIPYGSDTDLVSDPSGLLLVCAQGAANCMLRCVTCHKLHPASEGDFEEAGLLRMNNQGSALCIACHKK